jgi:hypothetical protein
MPGKIVSRRPLLIRTTGYGRGIGTTQDPIIQGASMSDKSPRQAMAKKSGKSLKEKRAAKHAKAAQAQSSATDSLINGKKR